MNSQAFSVNTIFPQIESREATGPSLQQLQESFNAQCGANQQLVCETVLAEGGTFDLEGVAETVEDAWVQAESQVTPEDSVVEKDVVFLPVWKDLLLEAASQQAALQVAQSHLSPR